MRVKGVGPVPARIMLIGEASGVQEEMYGRPFLGKAGRELTRYLRQAKIDREQCYITNVCKLRPETRSLTGNNPPSAEDIRRDEPELIDEISRVKPKFIGAVGAVAARWLLRGAYDSIESQHGLPYPLHPKRVQQCGLSSTHPPYCIVLTHPAAGLHSPEQQPQIYFDMMALGQYVRGELPLTVPVDEYPDPDYREVVHARDVHLMRTLPVYIDTEGLLGRVWGLSYTQTPGNAVVIRKPSVAALHQFRDRLRGKRIVMHHAVHDIPIIAELLSMSSMEFLSWIDGFDDTMVKAYVLRTVPLALKAAGKRFHGMDMESYLDVVRDADRKIATEYLKRLLRTNICTECDGAGEYVDRDRVSEKTGKLLQPQVVTCVACKGDGTSLPDPPETIEYIDGEVKKRRGHRAGRRIRNILRDLRTKTEDVNPRQRFDAIDYDYRIQVEDVAGPMPLVSLDDVEPQERAIVYSGKDADTTARYDRTLDTLLALPDNEKLQRVYEIDRNALPLLVRMTEVGIKVDVDALRRLSVRLTDENDAIARQLKGLAGRYINPASSKQVAELLFDDWGLPSITKTKGDDESTADKVLEDLKLRVAEWPESGKKRRTLQGLGLITDHRERTKLKGAYADKLPRMVDKDNRVHTTFRATTVESGRIASADPGLQQIPDPSKGELGGLVRNAFIAPDGYLLVESDYSQMELRYGAHDSGDKNMIRVYKKNEDIHAQTAARMFNIPLAKVTKKQRRAAKTVNFSILYGITAQGLKARVRVETGLDVSVETVAEWINDWLNHLFPDMNGYFLDCYAAARRYGYAEDMFGRRRYLPGMHSAIDSVRAESERISVNHRIQGSCASIMKLSCPVLLDEVLPKVRRAGWDCDPLLTVHDAFVCQVRKGGEEMLMRLMEKAMTEQVRLKVPMIADSHAALSWGAMKG